MLVIKPPRELAELEAEMNNDKKARRGIVLRKRPDNPSGCGTSHNDNDNAMTWRSLNSHDENIASHTPHVVVRAKGVDTRQARI